VTRRALSTVSRWVRHQRPRFGLEDLYRELAAHRARDMRAALAGECDAERLFAQSAAALEDAAGVLHHAAATYVSPDGGASRQLDLHAVGLEAAAARFEIAADITRARQAR
jgi:hypothetical protein